MGERGGTDFVVSSAGRQIPATIWVPKNVDHAPVVLLGHGGSGHRRIARHQRFADNLNAAGLACLAIDGPYHGDRRIPGDDAWGYQQRVAAEGAAIVHKRMRQDWLRSLAAAVDAWPVDGDRVGFLGMSMGARYGLMVCAALTTRLRCAVLGKFGLRCHPDMGTLAADTLIKASARAVTAPVLWHMQWDDEIFPREGQFELLDMVASSDKQLRARTGTHAITRPDDEDAWIMHLRRHLLDP